MKKVKKHIHKWYPHEVVKGFFLCRSCNKIGSNIDKRSIGKKIIVIGATD